MRQDPSRLGGGSTLSPAYSAALEQLVQKRTQKKPSILDNVLGGLKGVGGGLLSIPATAADIVAKPFEAIPGVPDFNPEDIGSFNFFVQGGKDLQHVYGDAKELARSIFTGEDTLSQSPTAQAYQAAGGGLAGVLAAASPYVGLGSVVAPMAMSAGRGAGVIAPKPVPYTPLTNADIPVTPYRATRNALAEDMAQAQVMTPDELNAFARIVHADPTITGGTNKGLSYVWGGEPMINDRLRGDYLGDAFDAEIAEAQAFFQRVPPLQRPVKVFRGIMVERPEAGTNAYSDFVRTWKPGDVIEEPGFMSTTIDRKIAEGYSNAGRVLEIEIPKGTRVATPEMFGEAYKSIEQEMTLPPNTKLQIISVSDEVIKAKVVPADTRVTKTQTVRDEMLMYAPEVTASTERPIIEPIGRPVSPIPVTPYRATRNALAEDMAHATPMTSDDLLSYVRRARTMGTKRAKMPNEFEVISDYLGPDFPQYQNVLRGNTVDDVITANIGKAQTLFEKLYPLDRPTILYRGIKNDNYVPRKQYANFIKSLKPGDVIEEVGFMSTTIDRNIAEGFSKDGFVVEITAPRGTPVVSPLMGDDIMRTYLDPERELLMAPNTKLEITSIEGKTIRARVVPSGTPVTRSVSE